MTGTVLYDGGTSFRLTPQMANVAYGPHVGAQSGRRGKLGVAEGAIVQCATSTAAFDVAVKMDGTVKAGTAWIPASLPWRAGRRAVEWWS